MNIRPATEQDAPQLIPLLAFMGERYQMSLKTMLARIRAFQKPDHQLLVVEMDQKLVGLVAFACYEHFRLTGPGCYVDAVVVDPEYRHHKIGATLMGAAEDYARQRGAKTIEFTTANFRRAHGTHAFHASLGYKTHDQQDCTYFEKDL